VSNTPQNNGALRKAKARRGRAAFAKITTSQTSVKPGFSSGDNRNVKVRFLAQVQP
jgi:hypothetical protein